VFVKPSLLDELGLDEETLSWHNLALCKNMRPERDESGELVDLFFEAYEEDEETAKAMDDICLRCPVMKDCLLAATDNKDYGLRGAVFLNNGKPDKAANSHKTPEVWARIQERLK
jgi:hypothetical protein